MYAYDSNLGQLLCIFFRIILSIFSLVIYHPHQTMYAEFECLIDLRFGVIGSLSTFVRRSDVRIVVCNPSFGMSHSPVFSVFSFKLFPFHLEIVFFIDVTNCVPLDLMTPLSSRAYVSSTAFSIAL